MSIYSIDEEIDKRLIVNFKTSERHDAILFKLGYIDALYSNNIITYEEYEELWNMYTV